MAAHVAIKQRADQCTSRPDSAGGPVALYSSRPPSAGSGWKPRTRPTSSYGDGPSRLQSGSGLGAPTSPCSVASQLLPGRVLHVDLDRSRGTQLGMKIRPAGTLLEVTKVKEEGLVAEWNEAHPESAVHAGDRILEINGISGNAESMLQECAREALLRLIVDGAHDAEAAP